MIAYHIDRIKHLKSGDKISLQKFNDIKPKQLNKFLNERYPEGLSRHGDHYLASPAQTQEEIPNHFFELIVEYERLANYQKMPSRFQSFFACESKSDLYDWIEFLQIKDPTIFEVHSSSSKIKCLDASFLNVPSSDSYTNLGQSYCANAYWKGKNGNKPLKELLIKGDVTIGNKLNI